MSDTCCISCLNHVLNSNMHHTSWYPTDISYTWQWIDISTNSDGVINLRLSFSTSFNIPERQWHPRKRGYEYISRDPLTLSKQRWKIDSCYKWAGMYIDIHQDTDHHVESYPSQWAPIPHLQIKSLQAKGLRGNYSRKHTTPHTKRQTGKEDLHTVDTADRGQYKIIAYVLAMLCHI